MKYCTIPPSPTLAPYVRFFWVLEDEAPYIHRSVADGCAELIFHYKGAFTELANGENIEQSFSMIHAQSQHSRRFATESGFGIFGAYLYPFSIPIFFSLPSSELSNQMPDLVSLLGTDGSELVEK